MASPYRLLDLQRGSRQPAHEAASYDLKHSPSSQGDPFAVEGDADDSSGCCFTALPCRLHRRWQQLRKRPGMKALIATLDWMLFFAKLAWAIYVSLKVSGYYDELQDVKSDLTAVTTDTIQLTSQITVLNSGFVQVTSEMLSVHGQIDSLVNNTVVQQMEEAEEKYTLLLNGTDLLQRRVATLEGTVTLMASQTAADELTIREQQSALAQFNLSFSQQVQQSQVQFSGLTNAASSLQQQVAQLGSDTSQLSDQVAADELSFQQQSSVILKLNDSLSLQLTQAQQQFSALSHFSQQLSEKEQALSDKVGQLTSQVQADESSFSSSYNSFLTQLATVLAGLPNMGKAVWSVPGTYRWTVPPNVRTLHVTGCGGGGGSYVTGETVLGGGGAAAVLFQNLTVSPGDVLSVQVGAGGYSGLTSSDGGVSSVGSLLLLPGGVRGTSVAGGVAGGPGGTAAGLGGYTAGSSLFGTGGFDFAAEGAITQPSGFGAGAFMHFSGADGFVQIEWFSI
jgi:hypothetical protein